MGPSSRSRDPGADAADGQSHVVGDGRAKGSRVACRERGGVVGAGGLHREGQVEPRSPLSSSSAGAHVDARDSRQLDRPAQDAVAQSQRQTALVAEIGRHLDHQRARPVVLILAARDGPRSAANTSAQASITAMPGTVPAASRRYDRLATRTTLPVQRRGCPPGLTRTRAAPARPHQQTRPSLRPVRALRERPLPRTVSRTPPRRARGLAHRDEQGGAAGHESPGVDPYRGQPRAESARGGWRAVP